MCPPLLLLPSLVLISTPLTAARTIRAGKPKPGCARCYNAAVEAMATCGRWQEALAVLNDMPRQGVRPDNRTYSAASE